MPSNKFKIFLLTLTTLLVALAVSVFATESLLKRLLPRYFSNTVSQFQYDKELGVVTRPHVQKSILTDHIIEIFTNDIGSRNYQNKQGLLAYQKIIFCVGDSYTEGVGSETGGSYPFYLDLLLNRNRQRYEKKFAVLNLGLGAYGSIQSYLITQRYTGILGKTPDVIIYLISSNDLEDDLKFKSGYRHRHVVKDSPHYPPFLVALNERLEFSQLFFRAKTLIRSGLRKGGTREEKSGEFNPRKLRGLLNLMEFSKKYHVELMISYTDYQSKDYDSIRQFAQRHKILFSDYKPDLERMVKIFHPLPVNHRHSGGHFRPWVNFVIADNMAALLTRGEAA